MKSIIRKEVHLSAEVIKRLQLKANKAKKKLKPLMELILEEEAKK